MTGETWQRDENWVGAEVEDSFVMVHIETGQYHALNPTAAAIWMAIETPCGVPEITAALRDSFDVSEAVCHAAVERTLGEMQGLHLATPR